jgi:heme exporter protein D
LLASFGWGAVAAYTAAMALITVISVIHASQTYQGDITETRAEERRLIAE